eukprot:gene16736-51598_t
MSSFPGLYINHFVQPQVDAGRVRFGHRVSRVSACAAGDGCSYVLSVRAAHGAAATPGRRAVRPQQARGAACGALVMANGMWRPRS